MDVRDVVVACDPLLKKGKTGKIYNVCSGKGTSLKNIIRIMAEELTLDINPRVSQKLVRPNDNKIIIGSNEKIKREVGWKTTISLKQVWLIL